MWNSNTRGDVFAKQVNLHSDPREQCKRGLASRRRFRIAAMHRIGNEQTMHALAGNRVRGNDVRMQIVGQRNDREQKSQETNDGNCFLPNVTVRMAARGGPAESPNPKHGQRHYQPHQIEEGFHCIALSGLAVRPKAFGLCRRVRILRFEHSLQRLVFPSQTAVLWI